MFNPARRRRSQLSTTEKSDDVNPGDPDVYPTPSIAEDKNLLVTMSSTESLAFVTLDAGNPGRLPEQGTWLQGCLLEDRSLKGEGGECQTYILSVPSEVARLPGQHATASSNTPKPAYKPTETIDNNDRLWKDYVKRAAEEDKDMLDSWNDDLQTLLVFSGLFSAILTAFLIESHKDLKPDPSSAIVAAIKHGFNLSNNTTDSSLVTSAENSELFTPPARSVRINALWFTSLSMSLTSAAGAMLAKSWLVAYSRQLSIGSPVQRAEKRQKRFDGLKRWKFQATIDFLPFPLFFSIILFAIGLCDFLFGLHKMIAIFSTTIFISGLSFLLVVNLLRIIIPDCPFHIPSPVYFPSIEEAEAFDKRLEGWYESGQSRLYRAMLDVKYPTSPKWLTMPPLVAKWLAIAIHLSVTYLFRGLVKLLLRFMRLNQRWGTSSSAKQDWQARSLAWIVRSSFDDGVVRNALQLIPTVCAKVANLNILCKTEILSALKERFVKDIDDYAKRRSSTGATTSELAAETYALGHSLRLLAGYRRCMFRSSASGAGTRFGEIRWLNVVPPSHSTPIHLLCRSLSLATYDLKWSRGSIAELQVDLVWALKPASGLDDWLRLFLIQDTADLHVSCGNNDTDEGALSTICDLMNPVKLTWESSAIFLSAVNNIYSRLNFRYRTVTPISILVKCDSADFARHFAHLLSWCTNKIMALYEERGMSERHLPLLENASTILLKITWLLQEKVNLADPKAPNYKDLKNFIKWALTNSSFPIHARGYAISILSRCDAGYIAGWEDEIRICCVEIISQFGDEPIQYYAARSAVKWLIYHLAEKGVEGGRIVLGFLEDYPEAAAGIVAIIRRDEAEQIWLMSNIQADLETIYTKGSKHMSGFLRISPLNDNVPDEATSITRQILSKLIHAGLKEAVISRLAAQNGEQRLHFMIGFILQMVCISSSLAKGFLSDYKFTAQLISCAKQLLSSPDDRWRYAAILIQLSYRVVDVCSDEEQLTWHRSLIELEFLAMYATLLPFVKDREPRGSIMWDIRCSFPVLHALVQVNSEAVAESKVLEAIETVLLGFTSSGAGLNTTHFTGSLGWLSADAILEEFNNIRDLKIGTDPPSNNPASSR